MDILLGIALSTHLGLEGNYNEVHPQIRLEHDYAVAGAYYNSESNISMYAGAKYDINDFFIEGGVVTGYSSADIAQPYARVGYSFNDTINIFAAPAIELYNGENKTGLVVGVEIFLK